MTAWQATNPEYRSPPLKVLDPLSLQDKLVIDWGKGYRCWAQWMKKDKPKPIIELPS